MLALNLSITYWTGAAVLTAEDTPGAERFRPPKEISSQGGIKIIDPALLLPFQKLKMRATRLLESYGVKLNGLTIVDPARLQEIEDKLGVIASDWEAALYSLESEYNSACLDWQRKVPGWEHLIAAKQPAASELRKKFRFKWQSFDLTAYDTGASGNSTDDDIQTLPDQAMQALCDAVFDLYTRSFAGKEPTGKAWAALQKLSDRAEALSFINADASRLAGLLANLAAQRNTSLTKLALSRMDKPQAVLDILDNGLSEPEPAPLVLPDPVAEPLLADAEALLAPPQMPVFDSMGLF